MKYSAEILVRPDTMTRERFTDEDNIYNYFKELFTKKRERVIEELFSAPDVLERLSVAFKSSGLSNLVRISHDDNDFYLDKDNIPNDLGETILEFKETLHNAFERFYEEISAVLEIRYSQIDFIIELKLFRVHPVGQYPIQIQVSGLPESAGVVNIEKGFKLFVNKIEQNINKYLDVKDITLSFTKKSYDGFESSPKDDQEEDEFVPKTKGKSSKKHKSSCEFFPLYGVMLGKTTIKQLAELGIKARDKDSDKKTYKYYTVKDMKFWYSNKIAEHMYLTYTSPLPEKWRRCGLDWDLSYNEWLELFKKLAYHISIVKMPKKDWYDGKRTLAAEFHAVKKNGNKQFTFELYFNYSKKTSVNSKGTIYSLRVRAR